MKLFLIIILIILALLLLLFSLFLFLVKPGKRRAEIDKFKKVKFAHRGLHGSGVSENSMTAFRLATEAGYGIELDVRLSSDGELVVFHDDTLDRVTGISGRVDSKSADELSQIHLSGTDDTVPKFSDVLKLIDGRVPLLIEIKEDAMKYDVSTKTAEILSDYKGEFIIESFNPLSLANIRKLMPNVLRGQLCMDYMKEEKYRKPMYFLLKNFILNFKSRPDFIAFCHTDSKCFVFRRLKKLFKVPAFAWTVKSKEEEQKALENGFDSIIFEQYNA